VGGDGMTTTSQTVDLTEHTELFYYKVVYSRYDITQRGFTQEIQGMQELNVIK
jgi:hypothetical protein